MKKIFSAGIVIFRACNGQPEYLLLHYPHGHWDFPKGKIEKGETPHEAAMRELQEETGISAAILPGFEHAYDYFFKQDGQLIKKNVLFFVGQTEESQIRLSHEHVGFEWLAYDEAREKLTFENAHELLVLAHEYITKAIKKAD